MVYESADLADIKNVQPRAVSGATVEIPRDASEPKMFYRLKVDVKGY